MAVIKGWKMGHLEHGSVDLSELPMLSRFQCFHL